MKRKYQKLNESLLRRIVSETIEDFIHTCSDKRCGKSKSLPKCLEYGTDDDDENDDNIYSF